MRLTMHWESECCLRGIEMEVSITWGALLRPLPPLKNRALNSWKNCRLGTSTQTLQKLPWTEKTHWVLYMHRERLISCSAGALKLQEMVTGTGERVPEKWGFIGLLSFRESPRFSKTHLIWNIFLLKYFCIDLLTLWKAHGSQRAMCELVFFFLHVQSKESCQAWGQAPLPTESSPSSDMILFSGRNCGAGEMA